MPLLTTRRRAKGPATRGVRRDRELPLYRQLVAALREDIRRGALSSGDALPSESRLRTRFGVSRVTVRQALGELQRDGIVIAKQGKGTFVRGRPIEHELGEFHTLTEVLERHGYPRQVDLLFCGEVTPPRSVAEELGIAPSERCVLVKRRHLMRRQPVALTVMYLPTQVASEWTADDFRAKTVYELAAEHGLGPVQGRRVIAACPALDDIASTLGMSVGDPVLLVRSRSHLASGGALESSAFYFHPRRYSFLFSFARGGGAARPADSPGHDF